MCKHKHFFIASNNCNSTQYRYFTSITFSRPQSYQLRHNLHLNACFWCSRQISFPANTPPNVEQLFSQYIDGDNPHRQESNFYLGNGQTKVQTTFESEYFQCSLVTLKSVHRNIQLITQLNVWVD